MHCQYIAGLPTRTDDCKCLKPVYRDPEKNRDTAWCREHFAIVYKVTVPDLENIAQFRGVARKARPA